MQETESQREDTKLGENEKGGQVGGMRGLI